MAYSSVGLASRQCVAEADLELQFKDYSYIPTFLAAIFFFLKFLNSNSPRPGRVLVYLPVWLLKDILVLPHFGSDDKGALNCSFGTPKVLCHLLSRQ